jgi:hypothetical protein
MVPTAAIAAPTRSPLVRLASVLIRESQAVRATISRTAPGRVYVVRVRISARPAARSLGCVAAASATIEGSASPVRVGVPPRGVWCAGAGTTSVASARHQSSGAAQLRVRPPDALGAGNLIGHLLLGPTCPVERLNEPCDPVARPVPVTLVALDANGTEVARVRTLEDGSFALDLAPGTYVLHAQQPNATGLPSIADANIVVTATATRATPQRVNVVGDTGIR